MHIKVGQELAEFTARVPTIDAAWLLQFEADIEAANDHPGHRAQQVDQRVKTSDLRAQMQSSREALSVLNRYARLAWPTERGQWRQFGQEHWRVQQRTRAWLDHALRLAHQIAQQPENKPMLLAAGMTQAAIDALLTLADSLGEKNMEQGLSKTSREPLTHTRMRLYNRVFEKMRTIRIAAEIVHQHDAARKRSYYLYAPGELKRAVRVAIQALDEQGAPIAGALVSLRGVRLAARLTDAQGVAYFRSVRIGEEVGIDVSRCGAGGPVHQFEALPLEGTGLHKLEVRY